MNIPPLPQTDNIYKFFALAGLTILVVSIIFPITRYEDVNLKVAEVNIEVGKFRAQSDIYDEHERVFKQRRHPDDSPEARQLQQEHEALLINANEIGGKKDELAILKQQLLEWEYMSYAGIIIGGVLFLLGISTWYFLIQRKQDALLRKQLKALLD